MPQCIAKKIEKENFGETVNPKVVFKMFATVSGMVAHLFNPGTRKAESVRYL